MRNTSRGTVWSAVWLLAIAVGAAAVAWKLNDGRNLGVIAISVFAVVVPATALYVFTYRRLRRQRDDLRARTRPRDGPLP
jgi:Flp pilus assembly protein TadB